MAVPYKRTREVYWAAGIFEGEGSISCTAKSRGSIAIEMTDRDILERFAEAVGVGKVTGPRNRGPNRKPIYLWAAYNRADWEALLRLFYPLLGERRRAQADNLLSLLRIQRPMHRLVIGGTCREGHLLTEETLYVNPNRGYKHCKVCRQAERPPSLGPARGVRISNSKLTEAKVRAIRKLASTKSRKDLAEQFGVTVPCIYQVITGRSWQHVGGPIVTPKSRAALAKNGSV